MQRECRELTVWLCIVQEFNVWLCYCVLQEAGPAGAEDAPEEREQAVPGPHLQGPARPRDTGPQVRDGHGGIALAQPHCHTPLATPHVCCQTSAKLPTHYQRLYNS